MSGYKENTESKLKTKNEFIESCKFILAYIHSIWNNKEESISYTSKIEKGDSSSNNLQYYVEGRYVNEYDDVKAMIYINLFHLKVKKEIGITILGVPNRIIYFLMSLKYSTNKLTHTQLGTRKVIFTIQKDHYKNFLSQLTIDKYNRYLITNKFYL